MMYSQRQVAGTGTRKESKYVALQVVIDKMNDLFGAESFTASQVRVNEKWDDAQSVFMNDLTDTLKRHVGGVPKPRQIPKNRAWIDEKLVEYENDASRVVDLAGSKITFARVEQIYQALDRIERSGLRIPRVKDRFIDPAASGYRDILMNVQAPNGLVVELRLHRERIGKVSDKFDHALYEVARDWNTPGSTLDDTASPPDRRSLMDYV
ncbi:hypothetical protein [Nocardia higoensis]|uniref:hypothetical protein n=1 Tax=Nocardia higoensis TaxID=228599 RepID=UPI0002F4EC4D|nr:hypothetical protein [Nocardia higoensis]